MSTITEVRDGVGQGRDVVVGELGPLVHVAGARGDPVPRELAGGVADEALLVPEEVVPDLHQLVPRWSATLQLIGVSTTSLSS